MKYIYTGILVYRSKHVHTYVRACVRACVCTKSGHISIRVQYNLASRLKISVHRQQIDFLEERSDAPVLTM